MNKLILTIVVFFSTNNLVHAYTNTVKPLPKVQEVAGVAKSLEDSITAMYVSGDFKVPPQLAGRLFSNADPVQVEVDAIYALIKDTSVPNSEKEVTLIRYTVGDKRMGKALVEAHKAGIKVTVVTDFNPTFKGEFPNGEKFTNQVNLALTKSSSGDDNPGVRFILDLVAAGLKLGENIISQPIYNEEKMPRVPIMHEKALLTRAGNKKRLFYGTANLAPNPRYNRLIESNEPVLFDHYYKHIQDLATTFRKGGEIDNIPSQDRLLIRYADGSSQEAAFTDGKFNPNDRVIEAVNKPYYQILMSHFVITNRGFVEALRNSLEADPQARVTFVADDRFASQNEWGLAIALEGADVWAPFGKPVWGFKEKITRQVDGYVYQRPALDPETGKIRIEVSEDGPPTGRHVWHDKSTMFRYRDGTFKIFIGSLNLSNNFHNSEFQVAYNFPQASWFTTAFSVSVEGTIANERMKWAMPVEFALLRNALGLVTRRTDLEVPISMTEKILDAVIKRDIAGVETQLRFLAKLSTNLKDQLSKEEVDRRVDQFMKFYKWYIEKLPPTMQSPEYRIKRMVNIAVLMSTPNLPDFKKVQIMKSILWRPQIADEQLQSLILEAIKAMDIRIENPDNLFLPKKDTDKPAAEKPVTEVKTRKAKVYDWDDTIMYMPTKILLYRKGSNEALQVTTQEFAEIREQVGQAGSKYQYYEIRKNEERPEFSSFKRFRANIGGTNFFYEDIKEAISSAKLDWMGPSLMNFIEDLSDAERAKDTYILTARGHAPIEIQQGLDVLAKFVKDKYGKTIHQIPIENIFAVGAAQDPSGKKSEILLKLADAYKNKGYAGLVFKDDDLGNVRKAQEAFTKTSFDSFQIEIEHVGPGASRVKSCRAVLKAG